MEQHGALPLTEVPLAELGEAVAELQRKGALTAEEVGPQGQLGASQFLPYPRLAVLAGLCFALACSGPPYWLPNSRQCCCACPPCAHAPSALWPLPLPQASDLAGSLERLQRGVVTYYRWPWRSAEAEAASSGGSESGAAEQGGAQAQAQGEGEGEGGTAQQQQQQQPGPPAGAALTDAAAFEAALRAKLLADAKMQPVSYVGRHQGLLLRHAGQLAQPCQALPPPSLSLRSAAP